MWYHTYRRRGEVIGSLFLDTRIEDGERLRMIPEIRKQWIVPDISDIHDVKHDNLEKCADSMRNNMDDVMEWTLCTGVNISTAMHVVNSSTHEERNNWLHFINSVKKRKK